MRILTVITNYVLKSLASPQEAAALQISEPKHTKLPKIVKSHTISVDEIREVSIRNGWNGILLQTLKANDGRIQLPKYDGNKIAMHAAKYGNVYVLKMLIARANPPLLRLAIESKNTAAIIMAHSMDQKIGLAHGARGIYDKCYCDNCCTQRNYWPTLHERLLKQGNFVAMKKILPERRNPTYAPMPLLPMHLRYEMWKAAHDGPRISLLGPLLGYTAETKDETKFDETIAPFFRNVNNVETKNSGITPFFLNANRGECNILTDAEFGCVLDTICRSKYRTAVIDLPVFQQIRKALRAYTSRANTQRFIQHHHEMAVVEYRMREFSRVVEKARNRMPDATRTLRDKIAKIKKLQSEWYLNNEKHLNVEDWAGATDWDELDSPMFCKLCKMEILIENREAHLEGKNHVAGVIAQMEDPQWLRWRPSPDAAYLFAFTESILEINKRLLFDGFPSCWIPLSVGRKNNEEYQFVQIAIDRSSGQIYALRGFDEMERPGDEMMIVELKEYDNLARINEEYKRIAAGCV